MISKDAACGTMVCVLRALQITVESKDPAVRKQGKTTIMEGVHFIFDNVSEEITALLAPFELALTIIVVSDEDEIRYRGGIALIKTLNLWMDEIYNI